MSPVTARAPAAPSSAALWAQQRAPPSAPTHLQARHVRQVIMSERGRLPSITMVQLTTPPSSTLRAGINRGCGSTIIGSTDPTAIGIGLDGVTGPHGDRSIIITADGEKADGSSLPSAFLARGLTPFSL